VSNASVVYTNI